MNIDFNSFMLIWGVYSISILLALGFGVLWGWRLKEKAQQQEVKEQ